MYSRVCDRVDVESLVLLPQLGASDLYPFVLPSPVRLVVYTTSQGSYGCSSGSWNIDIGDMI